MCEKAEEIQEQWHIVKGDYYARYNTGKSAKPTSVRRDIYVSTSDKDRKVIYYKGEHPRIPIWLPRQDQLQAILQIIETPARVIWCMGCWANHNKYAEQFTTMEQLWLVFVMNLLYQKIWLNNVWAISRNPKSPAVEAVGMAKV